MSSNFDAKQVAQKLVYKQETEKPTSICGGRFYCRKLVEPSYRNRPQLEVNICLENLIIVRTLARNIAYNQNQVILTQPFMSSFMFRFL